jgi:hypothetical protein
MSDWLSYELSDFLLFSPRTYYRLFELYNRDIWPAQFLPLGLGLAILVLWRKPDAWRGRAVAMALSLCWAWVAWAYFYQRYDTINWAARYFAIGFALQSALLAYEGVIRNRFAGGPQSDIASRLGLGLFAFSLAIQPLAAPLAGRTWSQVEVFGIVPDPTAIGTLGILVAAERPAWRLFIIPLLWCAVGGATLWALQAPDAPLLPLFGAAALLLAVLKILRGG